MRRHVAPLAFGLLSAATSPLLAADYGDLAAPGLSFSEGELFTTLAEINGTDAPDYHASAFWFGGHLGIVYAKGMLEGGLSLFDISDPRHPVLVGQQGHIAQREGHTTGHALTPNGWRTILPASNGINVWDLSDPARPRVDKNVTLKGILPSDYDFGTWWTAVQFPYVYVAGAYNGIYVVNLSNMRRPEVVTQIKMGDGFRCGALFAVGNLLIQHSSEGALIRIYDISDPALPRFLKEVPLLRTAYAANFNGGLFYGASEAGGLEIVDLTDLSDAGTLGSVHLPGGGAYLILQDEYAHLGNSQAYYKVDVSDPFAPFGVGTATIETDREVDVDFPSPIGNLVVLSDDHNLTAANVGSRIVVHDLQADTRAPEVTWVNPANSAVNLLPLSRVGLTLSDQILPESVGIDTFMVRPVGGTSVLGSYSVQQNTLTFSPERPLEEFTTYEVVLPAGGVADFAGNPLEETFVSTFTTGLLPIDPPIADAGPDLVAWVGEAANLSAAGTTSGYGTVEYSWEFGDGSAPTGWSLSPDTTHVFSQEGHYSAVVTARDSRGQISSDEVRVTTSYHLLESPPTFSSTITRDPFNNLIWVVNPDADSIAAVDPDRFSLEREISVGRVPRTLAVMSDGTVWVTLEDEPGVAVVDTYLQAQVSHIPLPPGSRPFGIAADPEEPLTYVSLQGRGEVMALTLDGDEVWRTEVGPDPRGLAVVEDSIFVSRFISPATHGEVVELDRVSGDILQVWELAEDPGPDNDIGGRGVPNYLTQVVPTPDGRRVLVPGVKQNTSRGPTRDGQALTFESTNRAVLMTLDRQRGEEGLERRVDLDNRDFISSVALSPLGDLAYTAVMGSQDVVVIDTFNGQELASLDYVGHAPQGLLVTEGGLLFVQNFMGRNLSVYDVSNLGDPDTLGRVASIRTVEREPLTQEQLVGKRIFYNSADTRMSRDSYISCAGCHLDGGSDKRVWDFTDRGEGIRKTIPMNGRGGTGHGPVHWSANFDEIQDFENDIRNAFQGTGFMLDADFSATSNTLGPPKAGKSPELDALAAYAASLVRVADSPWRGEDGSLTAAAERGRETFLDLGCQTCHTGPSFTDSHVEGGQVILHDVGTLTTLSGKRLGAPLTGLDTPTLKGVWMNAPYLHDGSAPTLDDVLITRNPEGQHGDTQSLTPDALADLVTYLASIDSHSGAPTVAQMWPAPGARVWAPDEVRLTYTSVIDAASVEGNISVMRGGAEVVGTLHIDDNVVVWRPAARLATGSYSVTSRSGITSTDGDGGITWTGNFDVADVPRVNNLMVWSSEAPYYSLQTNLRRGSKMYGNDDDRVLTLPRELQGLDYLRMGTGDRQNSRPALITVDLATTTTVYVAFDRKQKVLPGWTADFLDTGWTMASTDLEDSPRHIYKTTLPAGKAILGGPRTDGGSGNRLHYFVIFGPAE